MSLEWGFECHRCRSSDWPSAQTFLQRLKRLVAELSSDLPRQGIGPEYCDSLNSSPL